VGIEEISNLLQRTLPRNCNSGTENHNRKKSEKERVAQNNKSRQVSTVNPLTPNDL
jgi:hypothetical protein